MQTLSAPPVTGVDAPDEAPERWGCVPAPLYRRALSLLFLLGPPLTAVFVTVRAIGEPVPWRNLVLLTVFYFVVAHGVTIGFHRLFTHRSFEARRPLKIVLAVLGSMSFQGSLIGWVADHRRHHRYTDRPGDPHSPVTRDNTPIAGWRGFVHAHMGWVFSNASTPRAEFAPDLLGDPDLVLIDRLFVPCCIATLALPFGARICADGHAGRRTRRIGLGGHPARRTRSPPHVGHQLGVPSLRDPTVPHPGPEHELRTACDAHGRRVLAQRPPRVPDARGDGVDPGQIDTSARLIRWFERLGWVTHVRWPNQLQLDARRVG